MNWNTRNSVSVVEKGEKREKRKREKRKGRKREKGGGMYSPSSHSHFLLYFP